jgi:hypothetical protein
MIKSVVFVVLPERKCGREPKESCSVLTLKCPDTLVLPDRLRETAGMSYMTVKSNKLTILSTGRLVYFRIIECERARGLQLTLLPGPLGAEVPIT